MADTHALTRTSPKGKGQQFIGTCFKCGTKNLPAEAVSWPCENPANLSRDEALMIAISDRDGGSAGDACGSTAKQRQPGPEQSEGIAND